MCMRMYMYVRACVMRRVCVLGCVCPVFVFMSMFGVVGSWSHHVLPSNVKSQKSVLHLLKTVVQSAQVSTWCVLCPVEVHNRVSSGERLGQKEMSCCETGLHFVVLGPLRKMQVQQITNR